jgi:DNA (cytosine-5)-methyltransferase 1
VTTSPVLAELTTAATSHRRGVIDLFAGIGGFAHALLDPRFGYHLELTVEMDPDARAVYAASFPEHDPSRYVTNVRQLTHVTTEGAMPTVEQVSAWEAAGMPDGGLLPATDEQIRAALRAHGANPDDCLILCAGFPCQSFSKGGAQLGVRDRVRGTLFSDVARIAEATGAEYVLGENVPNLAGAKHREWFTTILERLREAGYGVSDEEVYLSPDRLAPELGGTPQIRKRLFIAARRLTAEQIAADPHALHQGVDLDALSEMFSWDPARWDAEEICDPDDSFDTAPYLLAEREVVWINAWNELIQALPCDEIPLELYADTFTPGFTIPEGTHTAAAARMRRSHAFYLTQRKVCDEWMTKTWLLDGVPVRAMDFPKTRRILEFQARSAQPTAADRDIWQCTFSMRSSGIRVKPLTTLPALVALNTTSAIGPRGRYITPREAARLQGHPVAVWEPPIPKPGAYRVPKPELEQCPQVTAIHAAETDPVELAAAAARVSDIWWERGGQCEEAVIEAVTSADAAGASPGEILLAAGALCARQRRWRGSGLRWADLAWDTYRMLASSADVVAFDEGFAALDWRVRRRATVAAARAAGCDPQQYPEVDDALEWFAERVDVRLPSGGESWTDRAHDIAVAVRGFGLSATWLRYVHRSALLARWDESQFPLSGLVELDEALERTGVLRLFDRSPAGTHGQFRARWHAGQRSVGAEMNLPGGGGGGSRNAGRGMSTSLLPLTETTLSSGRGRLEQITAVWKAGVERLERLAADGHSDPRTQAAVLDAQRQYVLAAYDLRRHRSLVSHLKHAGLVAAALCVHARKQGHDDVDLQDAALACTESWARYVLVPPNGPAPALVLPEVPDTDEAPPWLLAATRTDGPEPESLDQEIARADAVVAVASQCSGTPGHVLGAHYERTRGVFEHVRGLYKSGALSLLDADRVVMALVRRPGLIDLAQEILVLAGTVSKAALNAHELRAVGAPESVSIVGSEDVGSEDVGSEDVGPDGVGSEVVEVSHRAHLGFFPHLVSRRRTTVRDSVAALMSRAGLPGELPNLSGGSNSMDPEPTQHR